MTSRRRRGLRYTGIYAGLVPFVLVALFPVVWMAITAFKHERDLYSMKFPLRPAVHPDVVRRLGAEHGPRVRRRGHHHPADGGPRGLRAGAPASTRGGGRRHRHVHDLSGAADRPLPSAGARPVEG